ncbi:MAG: HEAT repeat domain-containing protein [Syntrophotaleaceae bacterium]
MNQFSNEHNRPPRLNQQDETTAALIAIGKLFKAVRFYPSGHPALRSTCEETRNLLAPLLLQGNLTLTIRKSGFFLQDEPVGSDIPVLKDLAFSFFARLVHRLLILPELTARDLEAFARCATGEPDDIRRQGGLQELMLQSRVSSLFVNEIDLQTVQAYRQQILVDQRADPSEQDHPPTEQDQALEQNSEEILSPELLLENLQTVQLDLAQLIEQLKKDHSDRRYRLLCHKLVAVLPEYLHESDLATPRKALLLLARHGADKNRSSIQRRTSLQALEEISTPLLLKSFINALCDQCQHNAGRYGIVEALATMQEKAAQALVERLVTEDNSQIRKLLSETLVKLGDCAAPALIERLADSRWYIARNAVTILGRIKNRKTAIHIRPYLDHRDYRVRREAVRALGRIGGPVALKGLQQLVDNRDRELCPLAIIALGTMRNEAAVESLLDLLTTFDPLLKLLDLKIGAIKALGAIGSPQAAPSLIKILHRKRLWKRNQYNKLRSIAARALANITCEDVEPALVAASQDPAPPVAHAAREALEKIQHKEQE